MATSTFRELIVWQKAIHLVVQVYQWTGHFPPTEQYGLTNQIRRAAVSIPSNIAEGQGRGSSKDFVRFLQIARGSLQELLTQLLIARQLNFLSSELYAVAEPLCEEVARLINGLIRSLETNSASA